MMPRCLTVCFTAAMVASAILTTAVVAAGAAGKARSIRFPAKRPERWSYVHPRAGEVLEVSPPGFSWWRAARRGTVRYRLRVLNEAGQLAYRSEPLGDPVCVPAKVLPPGRYTWTVDALDSQGGVADTWPARSFEIAEDALPQPWIPAEDLLRRVPAAHPRLLFPKSSLKEVRGTLATTRKRAFASLRSRAGRALRVQIPAEPSYHKIKNAAKRRRSWSLLRTRRGLFLAAAAPP